MTRLTPELIKDIPGNLRSYDEEIKSKTGLTLFDLGKYVSGIKEVDYNKLRSIRAAVVPVTAGRGIIEGFCYTVAKIIEYIGIESFVCEGTDVTGFAEAFSKKADLIFAADDQTFAVFCPTTRTVIDNSTATGEIYAAALELMAGGEKDKNVLVIGLGRVGSASIGYLVNRGAHVIAFDVDRRKMELIKGKFGDKVTLCRSLPDAVKQVRLIMIAAPGPNIISEDMIDETYMISAPGIPLGLTEGALRRIGKRLIHDPLQLGVISMTFKALKEIMKSESI